MKNYIKGHILKQWSRLRSLCRLHQTTWKTTTSGSASTDGNNSEIHVLLRKGTCVRSQVRPRGIYTIEGGTGEGFLQALRFPLPISISSNVPYPFIIDAI
jgi:hypothetical protein